MTTDQELTDLARSGDWAGLESNARDIASQRISKAAELYLLKALLEQGKMAELGDALKQRPRATLRHPSRWLVDIIVDAFCRRILVQ